MYNEWVSSTVPSDTALPSQPTLAQLARGAESDLRFLLAKCASSPELVAGLPAAQQALTGFLTFFATVVAAAAGWQADIRHPGYVSLGGADGLIAPYHIAPHVPTGEDAAKLTVLARQVRVGNASSVNSTICLSGSAAMLGMVTYYGDVDFCEYIETTVAEDAAASVAARCEAVTEALVCLKARVAEYTWSCGGVDRCDPAGIGRALRVASPERRRGKLDFIAAIGENDAAEASNVLVWLDGGAENDARGASSAQQEVPIGGWMPRRLDVPAELCNYIKRLRHEAHAYLREQPVKAAKRSLSLAVLFHLGQEADALIAVLQETRLPSDEAARQRRIAAGKARKALGERGAALADLAEAAATRLDPSLSAEGRSLALSRVQASVTVILNALNAYLSEPGARPA